jgi:hypothetical protein
VFSIISKLIKQPYSEKNCCDVLIWVTGHCNRAAVSRNRYGVEKTVDTHVKFVYLMSCNHFQLARVNQLLQITYSQSAVFLNCQGKHVEFSLRCAHNAYKEA